MFESVLPDPGEQGLIRAARIFYVITALIVLSTAIFAVVAVTGDRSVSFIRLGINLVFGAIAFATGRGIEQQRSWSKWVGYILGFLELLNFPIGTVIGIAIIVYIHRASKAGLFSPATSAAA